jgi:hypothetical protein
MPTPHRPRPRLSTFLCPYARTDPNGAKLRPVFRVNTPSGLSQKLLILAPFRTDPFPGAILKLTPVPLRHGWGSLCWDRSRLETHGSWSAHRNYRADPARITPSARHQASRKFSILKPTPVSFLWSILRNPKRQLIPLGNNFSLVCCALGFQSGHPVSPCFIAGESCRSCKSTQKHCGGFDG